MKKKRKKNGINYPLPLKVKKKGCVHVTNSKYIKMKWATNKSRNSVHIYDTQLGFFSHTRAFVVVHLLLLIKKKLHKFLSL